MSGVASAEKKRPAAFATTQPAIGREGTRPLAHYRTGATPEGDPSLTILNDDGRAIAELRQSFGDPGDMGEPRQMTAEGVILLTIPSFSLWAAGHRSDDEHDCVALNCRSLLAELRRANLAAAEGRLVASAYLRIADDETLGHESGATIAARRLVR